MRTGLVAAVSSWLALIVALPFFYALTINASICGKDLNDSWGWLAPSAGALVFLLLGSVGLRTFRAAAVPVAFLCGVLAMLLLVAVLPGTQGIWET